MQGGVPDARKGGLKPHAARKQAAAGGGGRAMLAPTEEHKIKAKPVPGHTGAGFVGSGAAGAAGDEKESGSPVFRIDKEKLLKCY